MGMFRQRAGEELKGWHIYPLQLDDLSDISYSSSRGPALARPSALVRTLARYGIEAHTAAQADQLGAPSASEVGPIFYRWAAHAKLSACSPGQQPCELGQGSYVRIVDTSHSP